MSTTELAILAQTDRMQMLALWKAVEKLVTLWAHRYYKNSETHVYEASDLIQAGYLALVDALRTFAPERECEFTTHLKFFVRSRFAEVAGRRRRKQRPELHAVSLDEPLGDEDDFTRADLLTDPDAEFADDLIEREATRQDVAALMVEIDKLPDELRRVLLLTAWQGQSLAEVAGSMGVSSERVRQLRNKAARKVRSTRTGRLVELNYYRHVSASQFRITHTSAVEAVVLQMEQYPHI